MRLITLTAVAAVLLLAGEGVSKDVGEERSGRFYDSPVGGLDYKALPSGLTGRTDAEGRFSFRDGDSVTFIVGTVVLGRIRGKAWITPLDLVPEAQGDVRHARLENLATLLQSLDANGRIDDGITITDKARQAVSRHGAAVDFNQPTTNFRAFLESRLLPAADLPAPRSAEAVRNQLRRTAAGIERVVDVRIPLRDYHPETNPQAYVLGTLHRPVGPNAPARVPVIVNFGVYGKDRTFGSLCSSADWQQQEAVEDRYHSGNPDKLPYENHESVDTFTWVPHSYAVLRVDEAGIGRSPGKLRPWSYRTADDYADAVVWAGAQPWSSGRVGASGISYYAMTQWLMAARLPSDSPLKAMIPWEGGADTYRDFMYPGGLFLDGFMRMWSAANARNRCGQPNPIDFLERWRATPTYDPAIWDEHSADLSKIRVPFMSALGADNMSLHPRGNDMAFRHAASKSKLLRVQTGSHIGPFYSPDGIVDQMAFFDYWLKGERNGIMDRPPVKIAIKTGDERGAYWAYARDWPVPNTRYRKLYLDARPATGAFRTSGGVPTYRLHLSDDVATATADPVRGAPRRRAVASYSAVVQPIVQRPGPPPPRFERPQRCDSHGVSFATPPLRETMILAGHAKLKAWVSSTTTDMDLHLSLRVYGPDGRQVTYPTDNHRIDMPEVPPIQQGRLKVSHRALDVERSTFFQPVHTHRAADVRPLRPGEIVPVEVEFWPLAAAVPAGHRIVVDVQPYHGCGHAWPHAYGPYNSGINRIHTGAAHISYLQLPVVSGLLPEAGNAWAPVTMKRINKIETPH